MGTRRIGLSIVVAFAVAACGGSAPRPISTASPATSGAPFQPTGPTEVATVVSITDGDTIRVDRGLGSERVRYIGIDAPEPDEPGGDEATARNAALVEVGDDVVLETDVSDVDDFGRLLRYVWLHEGSTWTLVNLELIENGVAEAVAYPPDVKYHETFAGAQAVAKSQNLGVWGLLGGPGTAPDPTPKPDGGGGGGGGSTCHASYRPCLPIRGDLDCEDVRRLGKAPVRVIGPDEYRLDSDNDGMGCEPSAFD